MISVDDALDTILQRFEPLEPEMVDVLQSLGRTLAEDTFSDVDIPPFDNSAMDGYAIRAVDARGATRENPARLRVVANLAAGHTSDAVVEPSTAIRIMTGAPLPRGADTVVRFEETSEYLTGEWRLGQDVEIYNEVPLGEHVRPRGEDIRRGELVLEKGTVVRAQEIGVLASLGRAQCAVIRRARVAILATGDELVDIDEDVGPGKIRNSNEYSNAASPRHTPRSARISPGSPRSRTQIVAQAGRRCSRWAGAVSPRYRR